MENIKLAIVVQSYKLYPHLTVSNSSNKSEIYPNIIMSILLRE